MPSKYGSDHIYARQIISQTASEVIGEYADIARNDWSKMTQKYAVENAIVEPLVFLIANDNWMEFTLRYVVDYGKRRSTKDELFTQILDRIAELEGKVAMASATFHLVEAPNLDIRLQNE